MIAAAINADPRWFVGGAGGVTHIRRMHLELTDEQTEALIRELSRSSTAIVTPSVHALWH
jgi:hypothetical protein